ncbi:MAG: sulfotransferase domain-containing protein [Gaiellales bacterium]
MPRTGGPGTKSIAQTASLTAGRLSSGLRMLPGFLIVGGQRCGTTSMYRALAQHPLIQKPIWHKGVHYFDLHYDRGLGWYRAHFPLRAGAGRMERAWGRPPLAFESSPYYMHHPLAPGRIAHDLPGVKLIVLVRDPVERAHSAHAHELARGFEDEPFERALALEPQRLEREEDRMRADPAYRSHALQHQAYVTRGQYADQLDRLAALVGRERLLVLDSGAFFSEPEAEYSRVLAFLELPRCGTTVFERHNARPRPHVPDATRQRLSAHFEPYDARLEPWLAGVPSWRRRPVV